MLTPFIIYAYVSYFKNMLPMEIVAYYLAAYYRIKSMKIIEGESKPIYFSLEWSTSFRPKS